MKYSLRSLMVVAVLGPPLLELARVHPPAAGAALLVFLPMLLTAKYRLWWLFSCNAFGWGLYYMFGVRNILNMHVHPAVLVASQQKLKQHAGSPFDQTRLACPVPNLRGSGGNCRWLPAEDNLAGQLFLKYGVFSYS